MSAEIHVADAFTHKAFRGNPAAVCVLSAEAPTGWMQQVAAEMRHSETAFLLKKADGWSLRWFTPVSEVELCGHATLAAASVLWNTGREPPGSTITFQTLSGKLSAWREESGIALDFPGMPVGPCDPPEGISAALGSPIIFSGRTRFDLFIELPSAADVCDLDPDLTALSAIPARGIIITAAADMPEYDFVSRFFAPSVGVPEDPVTGSAHCSLGPFWGERLKKTTLAGFQCSPRGGSVRVHLKGSRVVIVGDVTPVLSGTLLV